VALLLALVGPRNALAEEPAAPAAPAAPPSAPARGATAAELVLGTYPLGADALVDGDTLRVAGVGSVRILGLDCEEVFKNARDRAAAAADFAAYARAQRGESKTPVKFGTPDGEAARELVRGLLAQATTVRLERDEVGGHERDGFDRALAHAILIGPAGEKHLALEVVRAGLSPYFVKYGRTRRWHAELAAAELEARAAKRGVWSPEPARHYPDYDERLAWWAEREAQVERWRAEPAAPERVYLGTVGAHERVAARVGAEVVLFGTVARTRLDGWPRILWLSNRRGADVAAVVHSEAVWNALDHEALARRFVTVRGTVTLYEGRPQVEIGRPEQVTTP
jgi:endonuclease YncB( thermonuclease family)